MLPFSDALRLLSYLPEWIEGGTAQQTELSCRTAVLLLRLHHAQLVATAGARPVLLRLKRRLRPAVQVGGRDWALASGPPLHTRQVADPTRIDDRTHPSLGPSLQALKDTAGFNAAGLQHLQRLAKERAAGGALDDGEAGDYGADALLPAKKALRRE